MKGKKPPLRIWSTLGVAFVVLVMVAGASLAFSPGSGEAAPPPVENPAFPWDVNVVNTEANPVPVVMVDPVRTPVSEVLLLNLASGTQSGSSDSYHVPSDQWLVIETISGRFIDWGGVRPLDAVLTYSPTAGATFHLALFIPEPGPFSTHSILNPTSVRLYAPPDTDVRYGVARAVPPPYTGDFTSHVVLSGYLTDEYSIP